MGEIEKRVSSSGVSRRVAHRRVDEAVGETGLVRLNRVVPAGGAEVYIKLEFQNPAGSVKDRIGRAMIDDAEARGVLTRETQVIEPTSGNTGIALAFVCAARGYRLTLCMPESMSLERRAILKHLGATLVLTPAELGMRGAVARANELLEESRARGVSAWMPQQFENPANPRVHETTTGPEIWEALEGNVDALVAGVGTGGTITGVTRYCRARSRGFRAIAVEPADSAVLSGGAPGPHRIQGVGAGFVPGNLDRSLVDEVVTVTNDEAFAWSRRLAREEGILGGISSGANVCAAAKVAARPEMRGKRIVTVACSLAERYLSTPLFTA
ncbi:MAG: cysteine synthase A [Planctomycetota bacterium]|nr:cysteine synthase A [Planctomycetota bacterium]